MRTLNAKDKVKTRNYNRLKSYTVDTPEEKNFITQGHNRKEVLQRYPTAIRIEKLLGYDE